MCSLVKLVKLACSAALRDGFERILNERNLADNLLSLSLSLSLSSFVCPLFLSIYLPIILNRSVLPRDGNCRVGSRSKNQAKRFDSDSGDQKVKKGNNELAGATLPFSLALFIFICKDHRRGQTKWDR